MQQLPAGTPFTLHRAAEKMISISDNTAADHLLYALGRGRVERMQNLMGHHSPGLNIPFLSTREMFILKYGLSTEAAVDFVTGDVGQRQALLHSAVDRTRLPAPSKVTKLASVPQLIEHLEWFASPFDLCNAMLWLRDNSRTFPGRTARQILSLNPGIRFPEADWSYIAYKGGSEPGVMSVTWLLRREDHSWFVLTGSANNPQGPINEAATISLMENAAALMAEE